MAEQPLAKEYTYPALSVLKAKHLDYERRNNLQHTLPLVDDHTLVGIEIEVENLLGFNYPVEYYWNIKEDHSLRNNGREFVSIPLRTNQVEFAIDYLNQHLANYQPDFSNRTSVHVHLNVRDMTKSQLLSLVVYYCLFEKHFFNFAGSKREESIFCVPLYKTIQDYTISSLFGVITQWHKYNALNLGTVIGAYGLPCYGTVEFRHLYGTNNKEIIINWINQILCLKQAALKTNFKELLEKVKTLNTTSEYVQLYQDIFGNYADLNKMTKYDFESCVSFVKRWEWGYTHNQKYTVTQESLAYKKTYPNSPIKRVKIHGTEYITKANSTWQVAELVPDLSKLNKRLVLQDKTAEYVIYLIEQGTKHYAEVKDPTKFYPTM